MAILNKVNISQAPWKHKKFDLSCDTLATHSFMEGVPVYYRHMIPNQRISINASQFTRLQPMSVPTYGRARLNLRAFFCPFEFVQPNFNEFITNSIYVNHNALSQAASIPTMVHYVTNGVISSVFAQNSIPTPSGGVADFVYTGLSGGDNRTFTPLGRRWLKIMYSLGYRWTWDMKGNVQFSMLPLLSLLRIYLDWYALSSYYDTVTYSNLTAFLKLEGTHAFTGAELMQVLGLIANVNYDGDYFTAAWDNPVGPNNTTFTQFSISDPTVGSGGVDTLTNGTPYVNSTALTEFQAQSVHALTDYYKRHQLVGARVVDRFLADFGVQLDSSKLRRSTYIGAKSFDIQIGDVTQTVNTASAGSPSNLGDYGGRGMSNGNANFDFTADSHGIFILVASLLPSGGYYQGYDRNLRHIEPLDFYNPDFDNLGVQAIEKGEVYTSHTNTFYQSVSPTASFGYTPRYAEYKVPLSRVIGDFVVPSVMVGGDSWHLMRKFDDNSFSGDATNVHHSIGFCRGDDGHTYDRIFNYSDKDNPIDPFYSVYHFEVTSYAPMKSLFDTYDFDHDEQHEHVVMETNGVKVN